MNRPDINELRETFQRDGVVRVPELLKPDGLALAQAAFEWSLANPGAGASRSFEGHDGAFYQDLWNPDAPNSGEYQRILQHPLLASIVSALWGDPLVWFMYEQVFLKEGGESRRTPWHQDLPYLPIDGSHLAVVWITFDPVAKEDSLEYVRGSHRGTLFNTSAFDPADETRPIFEGLPRLPNIEANRSNFDIVSWAVRPGDVIVFHPAVLHGGAPTHPGGRRRTLTLRYFGRDARYASRAGNGASRRAGGIHDLSPGAPFRHDSFPNLAAVALSSPCS